MSTTKSLVRPTLLVWLVAMAFGQGEGNPNLWSPGIHPFLEPQFFEGGGFSTGFASMGGADLEIRRFIVQATGSYDFIRKNDDNDQVPNEHGYTRGLEAQTFLRLSKNFFGFGTRWGETAVTPYRKYSWAPEIGAGHDFLSSGGVRWRLEGSYFRARREYTDYPTLTAFTPGPGQTSPSYYCICGNGVTGADMNVWVPFAARGHVLLHYELQVFRFHTTVTDPYNLSLTASQDSQHSFSGNSTLGLAVRY